jgi:hypothetical protein
MKECKKCKTYKNILEFHKWKQGKDGLCLYCKDCVSTSRSEYLKKYGDKIREKRKIQRDLDPERFKKYNSESYKRNKNIRLEKIHKYNEKNREKINERQRDYNKKNLEERRIKSNEYTKTEKAKKVALEYYEKNKETLKIKRNARNKLRYHIKTGKIIRPKKCEKCLENCIPEGHHNDYNKPLEIEWLCIRCHKNKHINKG